MRADPFAGTTAVHTGPYLSIVPLRLQSHNQVAWLQALPLLIGTQDVSRSKSRPQRRLSCLKSSTFCLACLHECRGINLKAFTGIFS